MRTIIKGVWNLDGRALETQNSILSFTVGLVFLWNAAFGGNLYERFPDTYTYMQFLPAALWGLIYAGAGIVHFMAIWGDLPRVRKYILLVKGALWVFIGVCTIQGDPFSFSGWLYAVFAVSASLAYIRIVKKGIYDV